MTDAKDIACITGHPQRGALHPRNQRLLQAGHRLAVCLKQQNYHICADSAPHAVCSAAAPWPAPPAGQPLPAVCVPMITRLRTKVSIESATAAA